MRSKLVDNIDPDIFADKAEMCGAPTAYYEATKLQLKQCCSQCFVLRRLVKVNAGGNICGIFNKLNCWIAARRSQLCSTRLEMNPGRLITSTMVLVLSSF